MKNQMTRCLLAVLLVLVLAISFVACGKDPAGTTAPETTTPEVTTPEETTPEVTTPEETDPQETDPEETLPAETLPAETLPSETEPEETTAPEEAHRHSFTMTQTFPTCVAGSVKMYVCECGEMYTIEGDPALGHSWKHLPENDMASTCTVAGHESYTCVVCGATETRTLPLLEHNFCHSAGIVSVDELRTGNGFELLSCDTCKGMIFVESNHKSGHHFTVQEDGSFLCACGAIAEAGYSPIGSMDFSTDQAGTGMTFDRTLTVEDGRWVVSNSWRQVFLHYNQNPVLAQALTGFDTNGDAVHSITLAFELEYAGTYEKNLNFMNLLGTKGFVAEIWFANDGGKLALAGGQNGAKTVLEPETAYLVKMILLPGTNGVRVTVEGGTFETPVTVSETTASESFALSKQFGLSRDGFACGASEDYAIYVDNMAIDLTTIVFEAETEPTYCAHTFEAKTLVDLTHTVDECWQRYTCTACGLYYDAQPCEMGDGHIYRAEMVGKTDSTCVTAGTATYECLICGETVDEELPLAGHTFTVSTAVVGADETYLSRGYEILGCSLCQAMTVVEGNHKSGHCFVGGVCACGASAETMDKAIGTMDFSTDKVGSGLTLGLTVPISDGKWVVSNSWRQSFIYYNENPVLAQALTGVTADDEAIDSIVLAFELTYTGSYLKNLNFINFQASDGNWAASIYFGNEAGKLALSDSEKGAKTVLEPENTYLVKFIMMPGAKTIKATVEGGTLEAPVTVFDKAVTESFALSSKIGLSRPDFGAKDGEDYTILVDNMTLDLVLLSDEITAGEGGEPCEHSFTAKALDENGLYRYTCKACGRYFDYSCETSGHIYAAECKGSRASTCTVAGYETHACLICGKDVDVALALLPHEYPKTPTATEPSSCTVAGYESYKCNNCDDVKTETLPLAPHAFTVSTQVMPSEAVYGGNGYELLGCRDCNAMTLVMANHASGHCFVDGVCACGAAVESSETSIGTIGFDNGGTGNGIVISNSVPTADGKWVVSASSTQNFLYYNNNPVLAQALTGADEAGNAVESIVIAFELEYTGSYLKNLNFINFQDSQSGWVGSIYFGNKDGKLALSNSEKGAKTVLEPETTYLVKFIMVPGSKLIRGTVEGGAYETPVVVLEAAATESLALSAKIGLSRDKFACGEGEDYTILVDNMSISYSTLSGEITSVDESNLCAHNMLVDGTTRHECLKCGRVYERESCETAGHILSIACVDSFAPTCTAPGYEIHPCYICDERVKVELPLLEHDIPTEPTFVKASTCSEAGYKEYKCTGCDYSETEPLPLAPHAYAVSTGAVPATDDPAGKGFELFTCECGNKELKKVIANHASGHFFTNGVCACGAKAVAETSEETLGSFDFSNTTGTGNIAFTQVPDIANGEWIVSNAWRFSFIKPDNNPTLKQVLSGTDADGAVVDAVTVSFKMKYTGTYAKNLNFLNFFYTDIGFAAAVWFGNNGAGKLAVYDGGSGTKTALTAGETYTIQFIMYPATSGFKATVEGGDLAGAVTILEKTTTKKLADFTQLCFSRTDFKCTDGSYTIAVDDLSVTYSASEHTVDLSAVNTEFYCKHDFAKLPIIDDTHTEADNWFVYECAVCGGSYSAQEAEKVVVTTQDCAGSTLWGTDFKIGLTSGKMVDGKFEVSKNGEQHTFTGSNNANFVELLDGTDADGKRVSRITFAYDFSYTGTLAFSAADTVNNYSFFNLMHSSDLAFSIELRATADGRAVVCEKKSRDQKLVLDPNKDYTFQIHMDPHTKRITGTVSAEGMSETVLFELTSEVAFTSFKQFGISRATYNAANSNNSYAIYMDNFLITYVKVS